MKDPEKIRARIAKLEAELAEIEREPLFGSVWCYNNDDENENGMLVISLGGKKFIDLVCHQDVRPEERYTNGYQDVSRFKEFMTYLAPSLLIYLQDKGQGHLLYKASK